MNDTFLVLSKLAEESRHILSSWRAHVILRRERAPHYPEKNVDRVLSRLRRDGLIAPIRGQRLFKVTSPYARQSLNIYELASEAYPLDILSHSSALEIHRLTDQRSRVIHLYEGSSSPGTVVKRTSRDASAPIVPVGTTPEEWRLHPLPRRARVEGYEDFALKTHQLKDDWVFGHSTPSVQGVPVRCTDVERTLIDGLKQPKYCGGLSEVFRTWVRADPDPDRLVNYTERLDRLILYQRVGFVMETLGMQRAFCPVESRKKPERRLARAQSGEGVCILIQRRMESLDQSSDLYSRYPRRLVFVVPIGPQGAANLSKTMAGATARRRFRGGPTLQQIL